MIKHILLVALFISSLLSAYYSERKEQQIVFEDDIALGSLQYHRNERSNSMLSSQPSLLNTENSARHDPKSPKISVSVSVLSNTGQSNDSINQSTMTNITDISSTFKDAAQSRESGDNNLSKAHSKPYVFIANPLLDSYIVLSFLHVF